MNNDLRQPVVPTRADTEAGDGGPALGRPISPADLLIDSIADAVAERVLAKIAATESKRWNLIMTVAEAAEYLGRTTPQVRALVRDGVIPLMRGGTDWLISKAEIDKARGAA